MPSLLETQFNTSLKQVNDRVDTVCDQVTELTRSLNALKDIVHGNARTLNDDLLRLRDAFRDPQPNVPITPAAEPATPTYIREPKFRDGAEVWYGGREAIVREHPKWAPVPGWVYDITIIGSHLADN